MKQTVRIIVTGHDDAAVKAFIGMLSDVEVGVQERKVPNPLSATREEAILPVDAGRAEREDLIVQMHGFTALKRYDYVWATLLRDAGGVLVLLDAADDEAVDNMRRLLRLFPLLECTNCVVGVYAPFAVDEEKLAETRERLVTSYPLVRCDPADGDSVEGVLQALVSRIPAP